ncbi:hypothetical protein MAM1_1091c11452 [Mucor ambiguus]|uniref:Uncharacterized protein n=1 Tax=Mucor ambiguus TaxID=91626 RepID=A0A0C9MM49_9FUNG|nr:hypothetical protein MAM1_1091c11452 [Mucor ambiguus]
MLAAAADITKTANERQQQQQKRTPNKRQDTKECITKTVIINEQQQQQQQTAPRQQVNASIHVKLPRESIAKTASKRQPQQQRLPKHQDNK